jgi:hypothetical protein
MDATGTTPVPDAIRRICSKIRPIRFFWRRLNIYILVWIVKSVDKDVEYRRALGSRRPARRGPGSPVIAESYDIIVSVNLDYDTIVDILESPVPPAPRRLQPRPGPPCDPGQP